MNTPPWIPIMMSKSVANEHCKRKKCATKQRYVLLMICQQKHRMYGNIKHEMYYWPKFFTGESQVKSCEWKTSLTGARCSYNYIVNLPVCSTLFCPRSGMEESSSHDAELTEQCDRDSEGVQCIQGGGTAIHVGCWYKGPGHTFGHGCSFLSAVGAMRAVAMYMEPPCKVHCLLPATSVVGSSKPPKYLQKVWLICWVGYLSLWRASHPFPRVPGRRA